MAIVAENIKRLREVYGITQDELGKIAGVSGKAVWKWEAGVAEPRMGAVQKIADHYGIPKSYIVEEFAPDIPSDDTDFILLALLMKQLNEKGVNVLLGFAKVLADSPKYNNKEGGQNV